MHFSLQLPSVKTYCRVFFSPCSGLSSGVPAIWKLTGYLSKDAKFANFKLVAKQTSETSIEGS